MAHKFGNTWWGAQWLKALERVDFDNRLPRGKTYARAGHVESIELAGDPVRISALVQGSAYYPYEVNLQLPEVSAKKCAQLIDAIAADPDLIAAMQDGELPPEMAKAAEAVGVELFPSNWRSMAVSCTCPDSSRVCKHIAAVFYVLADRIDMDPYLIFRLHGIDLKAELASRGIDLKAAVVVKPLPPADFLAREAEGVKPAAQTAPEEKSGVGTEKEAAQKAQALAVLRALPYAGLRDIGGTIAALFPKSVPLTSAADASALPAKLIQKAAKRAGALADASVLRDDSGSGKTAWDESEEDRKEGAKTSRFPAWEALLHEAGAMGTPLQSARPWLRTAKNGIDFECGIEAPAAGGRGRPKFFAVPKERFFEALLGIPAQEARRLPPQCECWREVAMAAARILKHRAVVPSVLGRGDGNGVPRIWWTPALRDRAVRRVISDLVRGIAPWASTLAQPPGGRAERNDPAAVAIFGLSAAVTGYVFAAVLDWKGLRGPADLYEAALECVDLSSLDAEEASEAGTAMARALRVFSMSDGYPWRPVLTVRKEGGRDNALINFGILARSIDPAKAEAEELGAPEAEVSSGARPVLLRQILRDAAFAKDRFAALSILKTLGRECPVVDEIRTARGAPARLPYADLKDFLFDMVPKLSLMGVTLMLPQSMRKLLRPEAKGFASAGKGFGQGFLSKEAIGEFSWRASLGGRDLSEAEFNELVAHAGQVIPWGEEFVYIDPEELARIRRRITEAGKMSPLEKMRAILSEDAAGVPIEVAPELRDAIRGITEVEDVPPPAGLRATLRPYQARGYSWLMKNTRLGLGSLIADDMGLGKTLQVIALMLALKEAGELKGGRVLAVLPTTLMENWRRELAKFAPGLTCGIHHGADRRLPKAAALPDVTLTSYGTLRRDFETLSAIRWRLLVVDEAQAIKNSGSAQSVAVRGLKAAQTIAMTGTPVENHLMEFWSILSAVQPRILGTRADFARTFASPIEGEHDEKAAQAFQRLTRPFMLRRLKSDKSIIADLPEKNTIDRFVPMRPEQAALYQKTLAVLMRKVEQIEQRAGEAGEDPQQTRMMRRGAVLRLITALKQICNSPSQYEKTSSAGPDSGKADALLEILAECREAGRKVLVFTQYREMGERLQDWIEARTGERPDFLHGGVTAKGRTAMVDRFQQDRTADVMIISLKAGGTGLNLTAASAVVHYDLWWNPAVEAQATDRAYRIGQRRDVAVYRFITAGTFEERINEMLESKRSLAEMTVATGEAWIGDLPAKELKRIFALQ